MTPYSHSIEAYRAFTHKFVSHPRFDEAFEAIRDAMRYAGVEDDTDNLMLVGGTGAGKSTLVRKCVAEWPVVADGVRIPVPGAPDATCDSFPVLAFEFPSNPTEISVGRRILRALGDPRWRLGDRDELMARVHYLVRQCDVRIIIGDEAQRMVDRSGTIRQDRLADWLKELRKMTGAVIVLVGLGRLIQFLDNDDQIDRRWDRPIHLGHYRWATPSGEDLTEDQADFIGVVVALMDASPVPYASALRPDHSEGEEDGEDIEGKRAFPFFYASRGVMGYLVKLFRTVLKLAAKDPQRHPTIERELLERAFAKAFSSSHKGMENPFAERFRWVTRDGKPNLPPPLRDDTLLLASVRRRVTKRDRSRTVRLALTK